MGKIKVIVLDMDDTLYPEIQYVSSGFSAVSDYLARVSIGNKEDILKNIWEEFEKESSNVIDRVLINFGWDCSTDNVRKIVDIYRSHEPRICLHEDAKLFLEQTKQQNISLGLVSDGRWKVQKKKFEALGLEQYFDAVVFSDELGRDCWKPSKVPFLLVCRRLNVKPPNAVYVGDNLEKDFIGANKLGMLTAHIYRKDAIHKDKAPALPEAEPTIRINNLADLLELVGKKKEYYNF